MLGIFDEREKKVKESEKKNVWQKKKKQKEKVEMKKEGRNIQPWYNKVNRKEKGSKKKDQWRKGDKEVMTERSCWMSNSRVNAKKVKKMKWG